jgi:hypothetical protein
MPNELIQYDEQAFTELCKRFFLVIFNQDSPIPPLWPLPSSANGKPLPDPPDESERNQGVRILAEKLQSARSYLPLPYQEAYAKPLLEHLDHVVRFSDTRGNLHDIAEALAGAVVGHAPPSDAKNDVGREMRSAHRRFLAVASNFYRSFLTADKRDAANVPRANYCLPPLVAFHPRLLPRPIPWPAAINAPTTRSLCGSDVAVIVMPATYYQDPLAWVGLAHEVGGHGVLGADPDLLPDLAAGIRALFGGGPLPPGEDPVTENQKLGLLWSYWIEEATSDVYGLLNVGPAFALNLAAFLAAQRWAAAGLNHRETPTLAVTTPGDTLTVSKAVQEQQAVTDLEEHPTDLLRLHLAIGVIENLVGLSPKKVKAYVKAVEQVSALCRKEAWDDDSGEDPGDDTSAPASPPPKSREPHKIVIRGRVEIDRDRWVSLNVPLSVKDALESARRVGAFIASTRLGALENHTIQDIETWDEADEQTALSIRDALRAGKKIDRLGDDAQLLAGATLAALTQPPNSKSSFEWYRSINQDLAAALDFSYRGDPIMGQGELHRLLSESESEMVSLTSLPPAEQETDVLQQATPTGAAAKRAPTPTPKKSQSSGRSRSSASPGGSRGKAKKTQKT